MYVHVYIHCVSYVDFVAIIRLVGLNNSHWFLVKVRNLKWECRYDWVLGVHTLCDERERRHAFPFVFIIKLIHWGAPLLSMIPTNTPCTKYQ